MLTAQKGVVNIRVNPTIPCNVGVKPTGDYVDHTKMRAWDNGELGI